MRGLEIGDPQGATVTLKAVSKDVQRTIRIHPLTQVRQYLRGGVVAVQGFQLGPLLGLGCADKGDGLIGKKRAGRIEFALNLDIAVVEQVLFNDTLESGFAVVGRSMCRVHVRNWLRMACLRMRSRSLFRSNAAATCWTTKQKGWNCCFASRTESSRMIFRSFALLTGSFFRYSAVLIACLLRSVSKL